MSDRLKPKSTLTERERMVACIVAGAATARATIKPEDIRLDAGDHSALTSLCSELLALLPFSSAEIEELMNIVHPKGATS